jgi:adenosylcobinamide-phosphate synthase
MPAFGKPCACSLGNLSQLGAQMVAILATAIIGCMSFFAIALALLLEQVRPLLLSSAVHRWALAWARSCARSLDAGRSHHGWLVWSAVAAGPALLTWGVHVLLVSVWGWVGNVLAFAWHVAVLYATLGFRQFSHHFSAIRDSLEAGETEQAQRLLAQWMRVDEAQLPREQLLRLLMDHSVVAAHRHVFAVLGWYAVLAALGLGPAGAVLYRMSELATRYFHPSSREDPYSSAYSSSVYHSLEASETRAATPNLSSPSTQEAVQTAWWWIDYLPARMTAMGFAVVGSFEDVLEAWRQHSASDAAKNSHDGLVQVAMNAALGIKGELAAVHLRNMVGMVWRSVVLWLLLIALLTLARLLG